MSTEHADRDQERAAIDAGSCVTRVRICAGTLVRVGLEQILDGTRFVVSDDAPQGIREPSDVADPTPLLFILEEKHRPNGTAESIRELKVRHPAARVVVLADRFDFSVVMAARHAGADGFCLTTTSPDALIHSLELVMLGEVVVPSELILSVMEDKTRETGSRLGRSMGNQNDMAARSRHLSSRETEILCWLMEGATNKVIARKLNVTEATVKVHVKAILRKIGVGNRTQAAIWAADHLPADTAVQ